MNTRMSSTFHPTAQQASPSLDGPISKPPAVLNLAVATPVRDTVRGGVSVYFAQRRYARELITEKLKAQLDVETNRLALAALATKALDQKLFAKFIDALWLELERNLGEAIDMTEAEMRRHIESVVKNSYAAIKRYGDAHEAGDLPPAWRDRLILREENRTDQLIERLDRVLDELIDQRVKLMMGGVAIPRFEGKV